ncbi:hypothetical protein ApDm4_2491 [Acetobacter pomorum]|nr:hypothetical protein ApDm4_2491 [Acetobacter pomorum]
MYLWINVVEEIFKPMVFNAQALNWRQSYSQSRVFHECGW